MCPGGVRTGRRHRGREGTGEAGPAEEQEGVPCRWWSGSLEDLLWVGLCPSKRYVKVLTPSTSECDFTGIRVVTDIMR